MEDSKKTILATNLIKYRKKYGVTQETIANAVGIERSRYAHYEKGTMPTADILRKLATVLRVTTDELLYPDGMLPEFHESNIVSLLTFNELKADEKELVLKWRLLNKSSKDSLRKNLEQQLEKSELE